MPSHPFAYSLSYLHFCSHLYIWMDSWCTFLSFRHFPLFLPLLLLSATNLHLSYLSLILLLSLPPSFLRVKLYRFPITAIMSPTVARGVLSSTCGRLQIPAVYVCVQFIGLFMQMITKRLCMLTSSFTVSDVFFVSHHATAPPFHSILCAAVCANARFFSHRLRTRVNTRWSARHARHVMPCWTLSKRNPPLCTPSHHLLNTACTP